MEAESLANPATADCASAKRLWVPTSWSPINEASGTLRGSVGSAGKVSAAAVIAKGGLFDISGDRKDQCWEVYPRLKTTTFGTPIASCTWSYAL